MTEINWHLVGLSPWLGEQDKHASGQRSAMSVPPRDFTDLHTKWELARQALELAGDYGRVPEAEYIYNLHISVLKQRIEALWSLLASDAAVLTCVELVEKMHADPPAALLGYAILVTALLEANVHEQAEGVADLQAVYRSTLSLGQDGKSGDA
jgi:hypothetical protein